MIKEIKYNDVTPVTTFADFKTYMQKTHANPTTTKIFGGVAMIREVRKNKECYTASMLSVKNDDDAQSIGTLAASYQNCSDKSDPILVDSTAAIHYSGQSKHRVCKYDGKCYRFPNCQFLHKRQTSRIKKNKVKNDGADNDDTSRHLDEQQINHVFCYGDDESPDFDDFDEEELPGALVFQQ